MYVMLPVRETLGTGVPSAPVSPLQPNQMPPVSRRAARTPTASPPAVAALLPEIGVTRLETTTRRLTGSRRVASHDVLPGLAQLHGAVDQPHQRICLREISPVLMGVGVDVLRQ